MPIARLAALVALVLALAGCSSLGGATSSEPGTPAATTPPASENASAEAASSGTSAAQSRRSPGDLKPFRDVIPEGTPEEAGLFTVWQTPADLYFGIPDSLLGAELLLVSQVAAIPSALDGVLAPGVNLADQVVVWERQGPRVLLRRRLYATTADTSLAIARSVEAGNLDPVLAAFAVEALTPDSAGVVLKVTDLFTGDVPALNGLRPSVRQRFGIQRLDGGRSFVDEARAFPENVNVRHTLTFAATTLPDDAETGTLSLQLIQSMIALPAEPMRTRRADPRVGYFSTRAIDYGSDALEAEPRVLANRWRLVPTDPEAYLRGELTPPVDPIVFYLDPATPERWRPYFCAGVTDWNRAFEAAGFRDAVECRLPEDDPDFDPGDVRFSTVRYIASETRNAFGPSVVDPRTGEILESDVVWYHNHIRSYRNRLMIETGAANPRARTLNTPEELIGETMRQVIAHEVGHAIGLPHNMIASSSFPVDSLRSPAFTAAYGVAPSIMDYARQNYIAQPGDGVTRFVRMIGPYDLYAVEWGYRWFPPGTDAAARLDAFVRAHASDPRFRFEGRSPADPRAQTEDLGADPVAATGYALANLQRVVPNLPAWTRQPGRDYGALAEIYGELMFQWRRYLNHVVTVVGGVESTRKATDQPGPVFEPVPPARQREAVAFLAEHAFTTPTWLLDDGVLSRIGTDAGVARLQAAQAQILARLLEPDRLARVQQIATTSANGYPIGALLDDVAEAVWSEARSSRPATTLYRRSLQRAHLDRLLTLYGPEGETAEAARQSDAWALVRAQLVALKPMLERAAARSRDAATQAHFSGSAARIEAALDPAR